MKHSAIFVVISDHDDNNDDKHTSYKIHFNFQRRTLHVPLNFLSLFVFCFLFNSFFMFNFSYFKAITHCTVFLLFYLHRHHLMQQLYLFFAKRNNTAKNACHAIRCDTMTMPYHTTTTTRALMCVLVYNYKTLITFFTKLIITKTFYASKTNSKSFDSAALVVAYTTIKYNYKYACIYFGIKGLFWLHCIWFGMRLNHIFFFVV